MVSKELIKKIRHIEIKSNKLVDEIFSGEYRSNFKGKGMEFEDIRPYYAGDDVRHIDWNVTARHNMPFVKQFSEERELNVFLLIDMSNSNNFGNKKEIIAELGATLSYSANRNHDNVGMIMFTDHVEKVIPSQKGKRHILSIIESILTFEPKHKGTNIKEALKFFYKIEKKRSVVFLISDFMDLDFEDELRMVAKYHDLVMIRVIDRSEESLPAGAIFTFEDLESGETLVLENLKNTFTLKDPIKSQGRNWINLYTDEDYVKQLKSFFLRKGGR